MRIIASILFTLMVLTGSYQMYAHPDMTPAGRDFILWGMLAGLVAVILTHLDETGKEHGKE